MKGKVAGFDIGGEDLHIAVVEGGRITRAISERLPQNIVQEGRILSYEAMGEFLKSVRKSNKLRVSNAALVLPAALCYCRRFTTAPMSDKQLTFNLPYEFRDYITDENENYFFDYSLVDIIKDESGSPKSLDLMAAAARKSVISDYVQMFRRAGFKLITAVPEELAYINLIRSSRDAQHGHCILDLGHSEIRLYMFSGDRFENVRAIDFGCSALDDAIADHFGVDKYIATTYRETNYEGAADLDVCQDIYNSMAVEVLKAINFYHFNRQGEAIEHVHCCGGGVKNPALIAALERTLGVPIYDMSEFWPNLTPDLRRDAALATAAAGAAMQ